jgi:hypothetical protein
VTVGEKSAEGLPVKFNYKVAGIGAPHTLEYLIRNDGSVQTSASIDLNEEIYLNFRDLVCACPFRVPAEISHTMVAARGSITSTAIPGLYRVLNNLSLKPKTMKSRIRNY